MKRCEVCVATVICVAVVASSCAERTAMLGPGADEAVPQSADTAAAPSADFEGTIGRLDTDNRTITVEHWPLSKTFHVPPDCEIEIPSNPNAILTHLKVGEPVLVTYSGAGTDLVADRIVRLGRAYDEERREEMERLDQMLNPSPNQ